MKTAGAGGQGGFFLSGVEAALRAKGRHQVAGERW